MYLKRAKLKKGGLSPATYKYRKYTCHRAKIGPGCNGKLTWEGKKVTFGELQVVQVSQQVPGNG